MEEQLISPPRTAMEVFKMLPEGTLCEVINGQLFMSPSPLGRHQRLVMRISGKIFDYLEKSGWGEVVTAPMDVYLDEELNAVQPDIVILKFGGNAVLNDDGHVEGVPEILIEILSKGNETHDKVKKKDLYEKFGVKEYFIVDPESNKVIHYQHKAGTFITLEENYRKIDCKELGQSINF